MRHEVLDGKAAAVSKRDREREEASEASQAYEVVIGRMDDVKIDDRSSSHIAGSVSAILGRGEETNVVPLPADDVGNGRVVAGLDGREGLCR